MKQTEQAKQLFKRFLEKVSNLAQEKIHGDKNAEGAKQKAGGKVQNISDIQKLYDRIIYKQQCAKVPRKNWSDDEINVLIWLISQQSRIRGASIANLEDEDWQEIAHIMPNKNAEICKFKWLSMNKVSLQEIPWTEDEDALLKEIIIKSTQTKSTNKASNNNAAQKNSNKWNEIAKDLYKSSNCLYFRKGKQCRERWNNYLDPLMKRGSWTVEEDLQLMHIAIKIGCKWSNIAKQLTGRTENAVKNRYKSLLKKERKQTKRPNSEQAGISSSGNHQLQDIDFVQIIISKLEGKVINNWNDQECNSQNQLTSSDSQNLQTSQMSQSSSKTTYSLQNSPSSAINNLKSRNKKKFKQIHKQQDKQSKQLLNINKTVSNSAQNDAELSSSNDKQDLTLSVEEVDQQQQQNEHIETQQRSKSAQIKRLNDQINDIKIETEPNHQIIDFPSEGHNNNPLSQCSSLNNNICENINNMQLMHYKLIEISSYQNQLHNDNLFLYTPLQQPQCHWFQEPPRQTDNVIIIQKQQLRENSNSNCDKKTQVYCCNFLVSHGSAFKKCKLDTVQQHQPQSSQKPFQESIFEVSQ